MLTIIRRAWRSLTADTNRLSIALGFAFIGLLFWARLMVIKDMPRTAVAHPERNVSPVPVQRANDAVDDAAPAVIVHDEADPDDSADPAQR